MACGFQVIGIDAYYTLAPDVPKGQTPTVAQAKTSWVRLCLTDLAHESESALRESFLLF